MYMYMQTSQLAPYIQKSQVRYVYVPGHTFQSKYIYIHVPVHPITNHRQCRLCEVSSESNWQVWKKTQSKYFPRIQIFEINVAWPMILFQMYNSCAYSLSALCPSILGHMIDNVQLMCLTVFQCHLWGFRWTKHVFLELFRIGFGDLSCKFLRVWGVWGSANSSELPKIAIFKSLSCLPGIKYLGFLIPIHS
jgi:hypothetical protein